MWWLLYRDYSWRWGLWNDHSTCKKAFARDNVDIVIFGHSHQAYQVWDHGVLYFNPGSPTDKRRSPKFSFGEILLDKKITPKIHYFL
ncbi:metallophosphoesterase family protein [Tepidibacillus marianensis]|uniref:metallophosphoesterase family protein n=1 Tax=Tepidibacillus marianensis TaxID=3131995 RepID=UPI0030D54181